MLDRYRSYVIQIQGCNAIHILCGLLAFGLGFSQFSSIALDNSFIDFRFLSLIHLVTGSCGTYMVSHNRGSICAKTLYYVSLTFSLFCIGFYAEAVREAVTRSGERSELLDQASDPAEISVFRDLKLNQIGKIVVSSVMIGISLIEAVASMGSIAILDCLASELISVSGAKVKRLAHREGRLTFLAAMKIFFGALSIALAGYLEDQNKVADRYVTIGIAELSAGFSVVSGIIDLISLYSKRHQLLNLKVGIVFSVVSAVMTIKTLDYLVVSKYPKELQGYKLLRQDGSLEIEIEKKRKFTQFVVHSSLLGCLAILFFQSLIAAIAAGLVAERQFSALNDEDEMYAASPSLKSLKVRRTVMGVLHIGCGAALVTLTILSFVNWDFSLVYRGNAVLFVGCLLIATGSVYSGKSTTLTTALHVLTVVSTAVCLEHLLYSFNMIFQSVSNSNYNPSDNPSAHTGAVVLYSIQAGVLFLALLVSIATTIHVCSVIDMAALSSAITVKFSRWSRGLTVGHFIFALFMIGVVIACDVATFRFNIDYLNLKFTKVSNGVVVFATAMVQFRAASSPKLLQSAAMMQIVSGTVAFFMVPPFTGNLYEWLTIIKESNMKGELLDSVRSAIAVISTSLLLALVEFVISVSSAMLTSYVIHHFYAQRSATGATLSTLNSTLPAYLKYDPSRTFLDIGETLPESSVAVVRNGFYYNNSGTVRPEISYVTDRMANGHIRPILAAHCDQTNVRNIFAN